MKLLTTGNAKTAKGEDSGYLTAVLHLAPANAAGMGNVCEWATKGCLAACLNTAGRGGIFRKGETTNAIQECRKRRTRLFFTDRDAFISKLGSEIADHVIRARKHGLAPAVRLNGTSDIPWETVAPAIFTAFPNVQFYDYTKSKARAASNAMGRHPSNYHLTYSRHENDTDEGIALLLSCGVNVAAVFARGVQPADAARERFGPCRVIDGDKSDLRFLDPIGVVVALTAKGRGRRDTTGFVIH